MLVRFVLFIAAVILPWSSAPNAFAEIAATDSTSSSPKAILTWLGTLRLPTLQGCPYVKVTITETNPPAGEEPQFVRVDGFLLKDSGNSFTIFVLTLQKNLAAYYPMSNPPFWPLTIATFEKESSQAKERASYKKLGLEPESSALKKELTLPNKDETNTKLWHEGFGRHLSKPAAIAVFASACRQNHHEKLATELMNGISTTYERYLSENDKEKPFRKFLENAISESLLWHATLQFDDPAVSREQLLATFRDLKERFPQSRYQSTIAETIKLLEPMVREDQEQRANPSPIVIEEEKIRELIFQLRDQNGAQEMQPGWCDIFAHDDPKSPPSPAAQLVKLGYTAVPQLIQALDDQRLTRSIHFHRGFYFSHYVLRVSDCAQQILERIASRNFYKPKATGSDMTSDGDVASTKQAVEKWWSEFQRKGEKQSLIDGVRGADENSPDQASKLLDKFNDSAAEPIIAGIRASKDQHIRSILLALLDSSNANQIAEFLRSEMKEAPGLEPRLIAARLLFNRGDSDAVTAMIEEWKKVATAKSDPDRDQAESHVTEQLIEFLTNSGRVDAIKLVGQSLHDIPVDLRMAVVSGFAPKQYKRGVGSWIAHYGATSVKTKPPEPDPDADHAAQALLVSLLDDRTFLHASGGIGEEDTVYSMPRLCDFAGFILAKRWPQKYQFHWSLYWTENDRQLREAKNVWNRENNLPLDATVSSEKAAVATKVKARHSNNWVRKVQMDSRTDTETQRKLLALQGAPLTVDKLHAILEFLTAKIPKGAHGFVFSAERIVPEDGFAIELRWLHSPRDPGGSLGGDEVISNHKEVSVEFSYFDATKDVTDKFNRALTMSHSAPIALHFFTAPAPH